MSSSHGPGSELSILHGVPVLVVEDSWHVAKAIKYMERVRARLAPGSNGVIHVPDEAGDVRQPAE